LAASGLAACAVLTASAAIAQTAPVPAPAAAADTAAKPAADAATAPKPSVAAKAKALLPWNKPKAAKPAAADAATAAAPAPAPAKPATAAAADAAATPKAASAAAPGTAAPKAAAAKSDPAKPAAKSASGETMSGPMAATHAFFGAGSYATPAPSKTAVRAGCTRLAHSSIDVGKENPIKFSREGIDNQIAALSKTKGWKATAKSDEKIICTEYVNLGLFGQEYTCRVETTVCPK
jgi:hypothetical protein